MTDEKPHDSANVYSGTKGGHWFKIASKIAASERPERSRGQWVVLALLVVFAVMGGSFLGFFIETNYLNPPTQVVGVCPSPAVISQGSCVQRVCSTAQGAQTETCTYEPAGYIVGPSGRIQCSGSVCVGTP